MNKFNFKDFAIKPKDNAFVGDKIKVKNILNVPITVFDYAVEPSKAKPGTNYLKLQIEKSGDKRVVFTGSKTLTDQIEQVPKDSFPFETTIQGVNERYEFT